MNSLFCVTYYSYNFNLKKKLKKIRALLRNHDFSGACQRPQLNKILRPRPSADDQKACGRVHTCADASAYLWSVRLYHWRLSLRFWPVHLTLAV